ncbi:MAG: hypothetical protein M1816_006132 [Peltula sp. TS41687]|nr:MAG: hypothetical protein M1816_006132 [Peltula sp. TS41687]
MTDPTRRHAVPGTGYVLGRNIEYCYFQTYAELGYFPYRRVLKEAMGYWNNNRDWQEGEEEGGMTSTDEGGDSATITATTPFEPKDKPDRNILNLEEPMKNLGTNLGRVIRGVRQSHRNGAPGIGGGLEAIPAMPPMRYMPY